MCKNREDEVGPCDNLSKVQEGTLGKAQRVDAEPQTDPVVKGVRAGNSRRKIIIRVIRKFQRDGEIVEHSDSI